MLKVLLISDPILRKRCAEVTAEELTSLQPFLDDMNAAMLKEGGIGLAANQVGVSKRIFILREDSGYSEFINPEIISQHEMIEFEEGCLSIPGVMAKTSRNRKVHLTWIDKHGIRKEEQFQDLKAIAIQHEMDHLNGKLYVDQFGPVKRQLILDKHKKFIKAK